jgi:hypothetical protein
MQQSNNKTAQNCISLRFFIFLFKKNISYLSLIFLNILKKMLKLLFGRLKYAGLCGFVVQLFLNQF